MKNIQAISDKTAIGLSVLCTLHCLALPVLVVMLPAITAWNLASEEAHLWLLVAVIPVSVYALTMGCRKHRQFNIMFLGLIGLALLIIAAWLGHDILGEIGEKTILTIGAAVIAMSHLLNQRQCRRVSCECNS